VNSILSSLAKSQPSENRARRYSSATQNLRTTFNKIVKRAGLKPWPKPFQNLRATRETELIEIYPAHVVVSGIGHSEKVARQHYLQTTDALFEKAVQSMPSDLVGHMVGHNMCETTQNGELQKQQTPEKPSVFRESASYCAVQNNPTKARTTAENAGQTALSEVGGAHSGAIENGGAIEISPDLRAVVDAWPVLSELARRTILQMVKASSTGRNADRR